MKKVSLLMLFILFICLIINFSVPAFAQRTAEAAVPGESDPYEVTLYRQKDYAEPIGTWKLAPGMRMLKIPKIDKVPLSIFLGSAVSALLFPGYDFSSSHRGLRSYDIGLFGQTNQVYYLIPYYKFKTSSPLMYQKDVPQSCSLIINRKDIGDWLGVSLMNGVDDNVEFSQATSQFYPLPEKASQREIIYSKIPFGYGPYTLCMEPGGNYSFAKGLAGSHPNLNDIEVAVTDVSGGSTVKFPDPNNVDAKYGLKKYGIGQISSLKIQYKGPFDQSAYIVPTSVRVVAPTAPDSPPPAATGPQGAQGTPGGPKKKVAVTAPDSPPPAAIGPQGAQGTLESPQKKVASTTQVAPVTIPNVSGQWKSSIGLTYNITQQQDRFQWTVANSNEKGEGTIKGNDLSASWKGQQGAGSSAGKITAADSTGMATQIEWKNGVRFYR